MPQLGDAPAAPCALSPLCEAARARSRTASGRSGGGRRGPQARHGARVKWRRPRAPPAGRGAPRASRPLICLSTASLYPLRPDDTLTLSSHHCSHRVGREMGADACPQAEAGMPPRPGAKRRPKVRKKSFILVVKTGQER